MTKVEVILCQSCSVPIAGAVVNPVVGQYVAGEPELNAVIDSMVNPKPGPIEGLTITNCINCRIIQMKTFFLILKMKECSANHEYHFEGPQGAM